MDLWIFGDGILDFGSLDCGVFGFGDFGIFDFGILGFLIFVNIHNYNYHSRRPNGGNLEKAKKTPQQCSFQAMAYTALVQKSISF